MEVLDTLIGCLRRCCAALPDRRTGANARYTMADIGLSAFSVFFLQSPSFLAYQRQLAEGHGRSNCQTLFGIEQIPTDSHIRALLDPVPPEHFFGLFGDIVAHLESTRGLAAFQRLGEHVLIALDGTQYHCSAKVHCPYCSTRTRPGQPAEYFPTLLCATLVAPGHSKVVPLEPEFVVPQDGHDKQDCESRAARRWLGPSMARSTPGSSRSISATTSMPASLSVRRCRPPAAISCSCASPHLTPPSRNTSPGSRCPSMSHA